MKVAMMKISKNDLKLMKMFVHGNDLDKEKSMIDQNYDDQGNILSVSWQSWSWFNNHDKDLTKMEVHGNNHGNGFECDDQIKRIYSLWSPGEMAIMIMIVQTLKYMEIITPMILTMMIKSREYILFDPPLSW